MKIYAGIDLHSNNNYVALTDENNKTLLERKLPNDLKKVLQTLNPYYNCLEGVVVESTFNWYWLVDGLMDKGIKVHLANPCAIKQYDGLKYSDDKTDALHLAELLKLNILPTGYIYPKEQRQIRDLLRKRLLLVRQRTTHILSFKSLVSRNLGLSIKSNVVKILKDKELQEMFNDEHLLFSGQASISTIRFLTKQIEEIEKKILETARLIKEFDNLKTVPGIGKILALTIMLETGDINRFNQVGNYASYCRLVQSKRMSNEKKKGQGNRKSGNKYLSWAYVEAANFAVRHNSQINSYYQRKTAKTNKVVAIKTVAHKIARACYFIIKDAQVFDIEKAFGAKQRSSS